MKTRRNSDKMLLESLVEKYGKNGVRNAIRKMNENTDDFETRELIYREFYNAMEHACLSLQRKGIEITEDVVRDGVEWFELHNEFYEV